MRNTKCAAWLALALAFCVSLAGQSIQQPARALGAFATNDCGKINVNGFIVTAGAPCGAVSSGAAGGVLAGTYPNPGFASSPSFVTPNIDAATGTSLALSGTLDSGGVLTVYSNAGTAGLPSVTLIGQTNRERFEIRSFGNGSAAVAAFVGIGAQGTVASPAATASGDLLLLLDAGGYDNAGTPAIARGKGRIVIDASENWTTTAQGTALVVFLTPTGSTTRASQLFLSSGLMQVGPAVQVKIPLIKSTTGARYVCIDTLGTLTSQAAVCVGT